MSWDVDVWVCEKCGYPAELCKCDQPQNSVERGEVNMLHRISVRIDIESETKEDALSALGNILAGYAVPDGTLKGYKVLTTVPTTSGLEAEEILGLLCAWKALLVEQRQLVHRRSKGGSLVSIALKYQELSRQIRDIKWSIFSDYRLEA